MQGGDRGARSVPVVSLREAAFGYVGRAVISGVSLDIRSAEIVAVLGANGSGKSTLVKGLLGLSDHQGGTVELLGEPLSRLTARHRIGYVPQRQTVAVHDRATAGEVVAVGRLPHLPWHGRLRSGDRQIVRDALTFVGLADAEHSAMSVLSGGQQRRVLIARALAAQPEVLIMDEPTAGVDETNQRVLAGVMTQLADQGKTLIVVTHELTAIRAVVSRAIVLESGHVVFDGPPHAEVGAERDHGHHHVHGGLFRAPGAEGPFDAIRGAEHA